MAIGVEVKEEHVLGVSRALLEQLGHFQGFSTDTERYLAQLLDPAHTSYRARSGAEQDPSFKQLIPYVIFTHRDAAGQLAIFNYTRGKGQGEKRLHSKRSIGVGGHISSDDRTSADAVPYNEGMRRELAEEVVIDSAYTEKCVGLINDDETPVGQVHLGVVHVVELAEPSVRSAEDDLCDAKFTPVEQLLAEREQFETWSQISLDALFAGK